MTGENLTNTSGNRGAATVAARREITIVNELSRRAGPAAAFVLAAKGFRSRVWLVKGEERFSAASVLEVISADLNCGERAVIEAEGPDAEEAVQRMAALIAAHGKKELEGAKRFCRAEDDF